MARAALVRAVNPATGQLFGAAFQADTPASVAAKAAAAAAAQREWRAAGAERRVAILLRFNELLKERAADAAALLTSEMGKPLAHARGEVAATAQRVRFLAEAAASALAPREASRSGKVREVVEYEPLGVVANVSAWNYPYFVASNVFAAALATGNAVLYKPSEVTPGTGELIADLLHEAGVPEDVFQVVQGGKEAGAALVAHPACRGVFFTGSKPTGESIGRVAGARLAHVGLELGGKDPVYVRADAAVEQAAAAVADGAMFNAGQSCCSVERVYVHQDVAERFTEALVATVAGFRQGDPTEDGVFLGPQARPEAPRHLAAQVEQAEAEGATPLFRGDASGLHPGGFWFPPTVLGGVHHGMDVMREESFGPVIGVQAVANDDDALELMNDCDYGLTAGVYTADEGAALRILRSLDVGSGYWNACDRVSPRLPWSGRRGSGVGATLGIEGLRSFVQPKALHLVSA